MPNWCDNSVRLTHSDKTKIDALEKVIAEETGIFNSLRPNPTGEWDYGWSCENWGTKWDVNQPIDSYRDGDNTIHISMDTAWAPPTTLYAYLVEQGWDVDAIYLEPGMGFAGTFTNEDGDDYYDYDISDLDSIKKLPQDVIEFGDLIYQYEDYKQYQEEDDATDEA